MLRTVRGSLFQDLDLAVYHRYCADCPVIRQNISPDVQDLSPGRFYVTFPLMKILRLFLNNILPGRS